MSRVKEIISDHEVLTREAFNKGDIAAAKNIVAKMSYLVNLRDQLVKKEMDLGIVH
jgi:dihydrodipicolinate reductase